MKLQFQVAEDATDRDLEFLEAPNLRALFPGNSVPSLKRLFVVDPSWSPRRSAS